MGPALGRTAAPMVTAKMPGPGRKALKPGWPADQSRAWRKRRALVMTVTELRLMATLANMGFSSQPVKAWRQIMPPIARTSTGSASAAATYSCGRR